MISHSNCQRWMLAGYAERVLAASAMRSLVLSSIRRAQILAALWAEAAKLRAMTSPASR